MKLHLGYVRNLRSCLTREPGSGVARQRRWDSRVLVVYKIANRWRKFALFDVNINSSSCVLVENIGESRSLLLGI